MKVVKNPTSGKGFQISRYENREKETYSRECFPIYSELCLLILFLLICYRSLGAQTEKSVEIPRGFWRFQESLF